MFKSITLLIAAVALFAGTLTAPAEARINGSIGFYSRGGFGIVIPLGRQSCRPPRNLYPGYGNYGYPGYGNYGYPGYGNYGYPGYGNYGYPGYGNYGYPGYGNYGYPGYRNGGQQFRDHNRRDRRRGHFRSYRRRGCR